MRVLKYIGIFLVTALLTLILVAGIGFGVLAYVIFTPEKLTPVVQRVADEYLLSKTKLDRAELTLVSTYPFLGVQLDSVTMIMPVEGAQSDTLVTVDHLKLGLDIVALIDGDVHIRTFQFGDAAANIYIGENGITNFNILRDDGEEDNDTTSTWTVRSLKWDNDLSAHVRKLTLRYAPGKLDGALRDVDLCVDPDSTIHLSGAAIVDPVQVNLVGTVRPTCFDPLHLDIDLDVQTNPIWLHDVLALVPDTLFTMPKEIQADAQLQLQGHVDGCYAGDTLPHVSAELSLRNGSASYAAVNHTLEDLRADATADISLSDLNAGRVIVRGIHARTDHTTLDLNAEVTRLTGDMQIRLSDIRAHILAADFFDYLPDSIGSLDPKLTADVDIAHIALAMSDIKKQTLSSAISAHAVLHGLDYTKGDSLAARSEDIDLRLLLPKGCSTRLITADATAALSGVDYHQSGSVGDIAASLGETKLTLHAEYNTVDTTAIPVIDASYDIQSLSAHMDTISVFALAPRGIANLRARKNDNHEPRLNASITADSIAAKMGSALSATTQHIHLDATARHKAGKENILLEWNPKLDFDVDGAVAQIKGIPYTVYVPQIKFEYSNRDFTIDTSRIELGNSDFNLAGQVTNIGPYLDKKGLLTGELRFTSTHTDVNQLLDLVNGFGNDPKELNAGSDVSSTDTLPGKLNQIKTKEANPFIVPKGVDMSIYTRIDTAYAFGETVRHVAGQLDCRDGVMTLRQMGFVCEAATLSLTGIYQTPRRNHIYAGLNFDMTHIRIAELINLIPQVDSILPMLRSFKGTGQVHLAAETYTNAFYQIKPSTTRAALSIEAKDLTLVDNETFSKIAKALSFKKSRENKIDSISVEIGMYKRQITVYPFLLSYGPWKVAAGGDYNLGGLYDFHLSALKPIYLGAYAKSVTKKNGKTVLKIGLEKCRYKEDFAPVKTGMVQTQAMSIRSLINAALKNRNSAPVQ